MNPRLEKIRNKRLIYGIIFVLAIVFLSSITLALRAPSLSIAKFPLILLSLARHELGGIIFYHHNLIQAEKLNKEVDLLRQKINAANEIFLENKRLKDLLDFKKKSSYKTIACRVIGRSPDNWSSAVIVDKGKSSGIKRGMAVINHLGLVGRVAETMDSTSKVMLINDPNFGISSIVQRTRQEGLISGSLGGTLMMRYLPKDADIKVRDIIVTSGMTSLSPKGLIIGIVTEVNDEFSGLSRYALIKPAANLSNIEELLVIIQ